MEIKFTEKDGLCLTPCPNNQKTPMGVLIYVGSMACCNCKYHNEKDDILNIVSCFYKRETK